MAQALDGLRVLDLSEGIAGPFGAKMLADFGAEVIKIERPEGDDARRLGPFPRDRPDPEQSALFLDLNRNKLGITLDVSTAAGRSLLHRLVEDADAIILGYSPRQIDELRLDYASLAAVNPRIVVAAVTPWGLTGPYRDYRASEIVLDAFGHSMSSYGSSELEPLALGGGLRQRYAGQFAALATLAACGSAARSGIGQMLDISMIEVLLGSMDRRSTYLLRYQYTRQLLDRPTLGSALGALRAGYHQCLDGWVHTIIRPQYFEQIARLIGREDWLDDPRFQPPDERFLDLSINHEISAALGSWLAVRTRREINTVAQVRRVPIFPVYEIGDVLTDPHFEDREFWVEETHPVAGTLTYPGAPFRMVSGGYHQRRPAPLLGEHDAEVLGRLESAVAPARPRATPAVASRLPLEGTRVLDMTAIWAGPGVTMLLGDLGAEVIRVESLQFFPSATRGHVVRPTKEELPRLIPQPQASAYADSDPGERPWDRYAGFNVVGRNKLSMTADLRRPEGVEIFKQLVAISDVVVDNYAFGVMQRLGLGDEVLRQVNPRLINVSMPMFGASGPYRDIQGPGAVADAFCGFLTMRGYRGLDTSASQSVTHMDGVTGPSGAFAVLCALRDRERTGLGQFIDFAQAENMLQGVGEYFLDYQWNGRNPVPLGNRDRWGGVQGCYRCVGDDSWVVLTISTDDDWQRLVEVIGNPSWCADARFASVASRFEHHDEIDDRITEWTSHITSEEAMRWLQQAGLPAAKVMHEHEVFDDPHIRERDFFIETTHPAAGTHLYAGHQWKPSGTPLRADRHAPMLGQDNRYVYQQLLGYSNDEYARLVRELHIGDEYLPGLTAIRS